MPLKSWQLSAIRKTLGVYSDRKNPPTDFVTFSHSTEINAQFITDPLGYLVEIADEIAGLIRKKREDVRIILQASSREDLSKKRQLLEETKNGKKAG